MAAIHISGHGILMSTVTSPGGGQAYLLGEPIRPHVSPEGDS